VEIPKSNIQPTINCKNLDKSKIQIAINQISNKVLFKSDVVFVIWNELHCGLMHENFMFLYRVEVAAIT
jgi:hypothetical protein